jgi:hypothetical protein
MTPDDCKALRLLSIEEDLLSMVEHSADKLFHRLWRSRIATDECESP